MHHPLDGLAGQVEFFSANLAHNLDFIPDDKLDWKPAPTANSAMEIAQHLLSAQGRISALLTGKNPDEAEIANPQTRDEAKQALVASAQAYAAMLRGIDPATLQEMMDMGIAKLPRAIVAGMAVADTIHHHGQIAYLQTLIGDTESHFDMSLFGG